MPLCNLEVILRGGTKGQALPSLTARGVLVVTTVSAHSKTVIFEDFTIIVFLDGRNYIIN
ncbi:MAG: hypothetical protein JRN68_08265 [Nitrososphaerota archaeon]|nr:hypothetical protein [Nitrososphaerota archaeon]